MDDLICRQDAIDAIQCDWCKDPIKNIPAAQKKGHWIDGSCSVCGCDEPMFMEDWNIEHCKTPFCPNCGAAMRNYED